MKKTKISTKLIKNSIGQKIDKAIKEKTDSEHIKTLINKNINSLKKVDLNSFATLCIHEDNLDILKFLIEEKGVKADLRKGALLTLSVENENKKLIEYLLSRDELRNVNNLKTPYFTIFYLDKSVQEKFMDIFWNQKGMINVLQHIDIVNYARYSLKNNLTNF